MSTCVRNALRGLLVASAMSMGLPVWADQMVVFDAYPLYFSVNDPAALNGNKLYRLSSAGGLELHEPVDIPDPIFLGVGGTDLTNLSDRGSVYSTTNLGTGLTDLESIAVYWVTQDHRVMGLALDGELDRDPGVTRNTPVEVYPVDVFQPVLDAGFAGVDALYALATTANKSGNRLFAFNDTPSLQLDPSVIYENDPPTYTGLRCIDVLIPGAPQNLCGVEYAGVEYVSFTFYFFVRQPFFSLQPGNLYRVSGTNEAEMFKTAGQLGIATSADNPYWGFTFSEEDPVATVYLPEPGTYTLTAAGAGTLSELHRLRRAGSLGEYGRQLGSRIRRAQQLTAQAISRIRASLRAVSPASTSMVAHARALGGQLRVVAPAAAGLGSTGACLCMAISTVTAGIRRRRLSGKRLDEDRG